MIVTSLLIDPFSMDTSSLSLAEFSFICFANKVSKRKDGLLKQIAKYYPKTSIIYLIIRDLHKQFGINAYLEKVEFAEAPALASNQIDLDCIRCYLFFVVLLLRQQLQRLLLDDQLE